MHLPGPSTCRGEGGTTYMGPVIYKFVFFFFASFCHNSFISFWQARTSMFAANSFALMKRLLLNDSIRVGGNLVPSFGLSLVSSSSFILPFIIPFLFPFDVVIALLLYYHLHNVCYFYSYTFLFVILRSVKKYYSYRFILKRIKRKKLPF